MIRILTYLLLLLSPLVVSARPLQDSVAAEASETTVDTVNVDDGENTYTEESGPSTEETYLKDSVKKTAFSRSDWHKITKGMEYNEKSEKPKPEKEPKYKPTEKPDTSSWSWFEFGSVAQTVLIILAVVVVGAVLVLLFRGSVSNTRIEKKKSYTIEELEDVLHESDLDRYLREAVAKNDYRAAIRIYYLMAIKALSERDWIRWKKDKTNNQYLFEMSTRPNFSGFREITRLFEYAWYGEMSVGEQQFRQLDPKFRDFLNELNTLPR